MRGIFITGTDTGVGKSVVCGLLAKYLAQKGCNVITQKWVQSGSKGFSCDINLHLKIMGKKKEELGNYMELACPYSFSQPVSPHLAAQLSKKKISIAKIKQSFLRLSKDFDFVLVEGIGGALVPLDEQHLVIDLVKDLDLSVLVVALNKLGTINHTLLTLEALRERKIDILGVVFNNQEKEKALVLKDNPKIIEKISGKKVLGVLSRKKNLSELYKTFLPIGKKICRAAKV